MTESTEASTATTMTPEQVASSSSTTTETPRRLPKGSREVQKLVNQNREQNNKQFVDNLLNRLTPEERDQINRISRMPVVEYYTLPGHQVDTLHRLFRRVITLNRAAFLQAAMEEFQRLQAEAKAKQEAAAAAETPAAPETPSNVPVSEPVA